MHHHECIQACIDCAKACEHCCVSCIEENHPECVKLAGDCAQICWNMSSMLSRDSNVAREFARVCERICFDTSMECDKYRSEHHKHCVETCKKCVDECRKMLNHSAAA